MRFITKAQSSAHALKRKLRNYLSDESGATAIEYGLLVVGLGVAIMVVVFAIGYVVDKMFLAI